MIEFPDISFYQKEVNWNIMSSKTKNIILRSSQGNYKDSRFTSNYINARAYGMKRGIYHFFDDRYSPDEQAGIVIELIKNDLPETRVWVDWENSYGGKYKGIYNVVQVMKKIEKALPTVTVGLYTGFYFFEDNTNPQLNKEEFDYLIWHPLWLAAYTSTGGSQGISVPAPWVYPPELHQWGTPALGAEYGVATQEIDMNRVLKNEHIYSTEQETSMFRYKATAIGNGTRIRSDHNTAASYLNSYPAGTIFEGDELFVATTQLSNASGVYQLPGDKWLKVTKVNTQDPVSATGQPITVPVWVAVVHMGNNICTLVDNGPTTPPDPTTPVPPQEVIVKDEHGVTWRCVTFTKVT